jgi:hypothetical protein
MSKFTNLTSDLGTSGWKVDHKNKRFYLPSLVAYGPQIEQVNGVFEADYSSKSLDNITVNTDFGELLVGNAAKFSQSPPWSGFGKERYANQKFMEPMTLAAMSEAKIGDNPIIVTTAIPAQWDKSTVYVDGQDIKITDVLTQHFLRDHIIDRTGRRGQQVVNVADVKVMTETKALLYSFLLDENGQPTIENYKKMRYAVADLGELTSCLGIFDGLAKSQESRTLTDVSMGKIHKAVSDDIYDETGCTIEARQVRDIVRSGGYIMLPAQGNRPAKEFDIMPLYQRRVQLAQEVLLSNFGDYITSSGDIHYIIVGGGGSEVTGPALTSNYRQAQAFGQFATAEGLRNYGRLVCASMNENR